MPFAKGVSAKLKVFDAEGNETSIDYYRLIKIEKRLGVQKFFGMEYEGSVFLEKEGIMATKKLLE